MVEHLPSMCEALGSILSTAERDKEERGAGDGNHMRSSQEKVGTMANSRYSMTGPWCPDVWPNIILKVSDGVFE